MSRFTLHHGHWSVKWSNWLLYDFINCSPNLHSLHSNHVSQAPPASALWNPRLDPRHTAALLLYFQFIFAATKCNKYLWTHFYPFSFLASILQTQFMFPSRLWYHGAENIQVPICQHNLTSRRNLNPKIFIQSQILIRR